MSKVTDMARAEAERAEAESPDEDDALAEADDAAAADADADAGDEPDEIDAEALSKAIERAHSTYERALTRALGDDFQLYAECEKCGSMGYTPPDFVPIPAAADKPACPACNGHGVQETASRNEQHRYEQCPRCNGNGWILQAIPEPQQPPTHPYGQTFPGQGNPPVVGQPNGGGPGMSDAWGRPFGHPHFGIEPSQLGV